ncbi:borealin-2-like [Podarcis raffonei]|uniref:borealin-2-like n=1 Tax=Podarcis raffonei TaxID=65483 RepID=UPI0023290F80|nr:borealin-2-like [Podarcis raffonei]
MALRKHVNEAKKRSADSGVESDRSLLSKEQRDQRISLFLRDFQHQAKENLRDLKKELASLLQTAEKAFQVELLAMPVVMRKMRREDLIDLKEEEAAAATVIATAMANDCCAVDMPTPRLVRTNSKRVKVTTIVEYKGEEEGSGAPARKLSRKAFKTNSLASLASAVKGKQGTPSRSAYATPNGRTIERSTSMRERPVSASKCISLGSKRQAMLFMLWNNQDSYSQSRKKNFSLSTFYAPCAIPCTSIMAHLTFSLKLTTSNIAKCLDPLLIGVLRHLLDQLFCPFLNRLPSPPPPLPHPFLVPRFPQRGLSKSASASERTQAVTLRSMSMPHESSVPFVNIPLSDGKTLCSAGDDLQNINVELLNEDTVQHIHSLVNQLTVLCGKATVK